MIDLWQLHSSMVPYPKHTTSSTKNKCVRETIDEITMLEIKPNLLASIMSRLRSLAIKKKKGGESGKPFLRPWITLEEYDGVLLIRTIKFIDLTHPKI